MQETNGIFVPRCWISPSSSTSSRLQMLWDLVACSSSYHFTVMTQSVYNEPMISTYPSYIASQTPTFDIYHSLFPRHSSPVGYSWRWGRPGNETIVMWDVCKWEKVVLWNTIMHHTTLSRSPHNALHSPIFTWLLRILLARGPYVVLFDLKPLIEDGNLLVYMYCVHAQRRDSGATRTHFRACRISKSPGGVPPDPPHTIHFVGPPNPLGCPGCESWIKFHVNVSVDMWMELVSECQVPKCRLISYIL